MPEYRKLHNCAGHSEKVSRLSDFEFRVWIQMRASADDFGVGPMIAGKLQGDNVYLSHKAHTAVRKAMEHVVSVGLLATFTHQHQDYYFQKNWQDYELVSYPKRSVYPYPPSEQLSEKTRELIQFAEKTVAKKLPKNSEKILETFSENSPKILETFSENSPKIPETFSQHARADTRTALALTLTSQPVPPNAREKTAPLIGSVLEDYRKHGSVHVTEFCDWVCLPNELANDFAKRLTGTPFEEAHLSVLVWAREVRAQWQGRTVPDGSMYDFWKGQWTVTHGGGQATVSRAQQSTDAGKRWAARRMAGQS